MKVHHSRFGRGHKAPGRQCDSATAMFPGKGTEEGTCHRECERQGQSKGKTLEGLGEEERRRPVLALVHVRPPPVLGPQRGKPRETSDMAADPGAHNTGLPPGGTGHTWGETGRWLRREPLEGCWWEHIPVPRCSPPPGPGGCLSRAQLSPDEECAAGHSPAAVLCGEE